MDFKLEDETDFGDALEEMSKQIEIRNEKFPYKQMNAIFPKGIFDYNPVHAITHPWLIWNGITSEIKWAWQRVFRGWDDRVIWSIDYHIAHYAPAWFRTLKEKKQGVPTMIFGANDWRSPDSGETFPGAHEKAEMKYNAILDIIADGFEAYDDGHFWNRPEDEKKFKLAMEFFAKYFGTFWD